MKLCPCEQNLLKNILSYNPPSEVNFDDTLTETVHFQDSQNYMQRFTRKDKVYIISCNLVVVSTSKVVSATFALVCFLSLNETTFQTRKNVFYFTSKALSFSRKSNFKILYFQISWCHQMPMRKTRNTFHWIIWEVNTIC